MAGLLEGEGSFSIYDRYPAYICIRCTMTDEDVLRRLHLATGVGSVCKPSQRPNRKQTWYWNVSRRPDVVQLLNDLLPHMGLRRSAKIVQMLAWHEARGYQVQGPAQHGSSAMYGYHKCRCIECMEYSRQQSREHRRKHHDTINARRRVAYHTKKVAAQPMVPLGAMNGDDTSESTREDPA